MLHDRRREMQTEVHTRIRHVRTDVANEVLDDGEHYEADTQGDIAFALVQMRAESLGRVDEAMRRLEAGEYGYCFEYEGEISDNRLGGRRFLVGFALLALTQLAALTTLNVLGNVFGIAPHVRDVRAWAVVGPLLVLALVNLVHVDQRHATTP